MDDHLAFAPPQNMTVPDIDDEEDTIHNYDYEQLQESNQIPNAPPIEEPLIAEGLSSIGYPIPETGFMIISESQDNLHDQSFD